MTPSPIHPAARPVSPQWQGEDGRPRFSFCTLVTDEDDYRAMVGSFVAAGFDEATAEFLYGDNRSGNRFDGFDGLNRLMAEARGRYLVCVHQDTRALGRDAQDLIAALADLDRRDPRWAVAGNAGRARDGYHLHISDKHGADRRLGSLPARVDSLDENFLVLNGRYRVGFSADLAGFHLYGTDIVLNAEAAGLSAWAIDFLIAHHGEARVDASYQRCAEAIEAKSRRLRQPERRRTLIYDVILGDSPVQAIRRWRHGLKRRRHIQQPSAGH